MSEEPPIFFDIDGTLTDSPDDADGRVFRSRIDHIRGLIKAGRQVVVWSARGTAYAYIFCSANGIKGAIAIGKPDIMVDDKPGIRAPGRLKILSPEEYFLS